MVSCRGTYLPSMPVNCSATLKGWDKKRCTLRGAGDGELILLRELIHAHDGDDVLQFFVALEDGLHGRATS